MKTRKNNREGSIRKIKKNSYECLIQSKYYNENGNLKRIKRRGNTPEEAQKNAQIALKKFEKDYETLLRQNDKSLLNSKDNVEKYMIFYLDNIVVQRVAASTYYSYNNSVLRLISKTEFYKMQVKSLRKTDFENLFSYFADNYSESILNNVVIFVRCFCDWLCNEKIIDENYARMVIPQKEVKDEYIRGENTMERKKIFTEEDIKKLYKAYVEDVSIFAPVFILMLETMIRGQEVLAITLDDIDFENRFLYIRSAIARRFIDNDRTKGTEKYIKVPKNRESRKIYLSDLALDSINKLKNKLEKECKYNPYNLLFPKYNDGTIRDRMQLNRAFIEICCTMNIDRGIYKTKAGMYRGLSVHSLRHTAISIANSAKGANVVNTALMAGHKSIITENIYTHQTDKSLRTIKTASDEILFTKDKKDKFDSLIKSEEDVKELLDYLKNRFK